MTMLHHDSRQGPRAFWVAGLAVFSLALPVLSSRGDAANKPSKWSTETKGAAAADGATVNPMCSAIERNLNLHIASMKALRVAIDKAASAPPSTVAGAIQGIFGKAEPNTKVAEQTRKLANERKAADGLNGMLRATQCAEIDIDAALASAPGSAHTGPEAPKEAPELLRLPQDGVAR
ncbi:MAG: hypothetical protein ABL893_13835 [Hyphomicrobium sp.]